MRDAYPLPSLRPHAPLAAQWDAPGRAMVVPKRTRPACFIYYAEINDFFVMASRLRRGPWGVTGGEGGAAVRNLCNGPPVGQYRHVGARGAEQCNWTGCALRCGGVRMARAARCGELFKTGMLQAHSGCFDGCGWRRKHAARAGCQLSLHGSKESGVQPGAARAPGAAGSTPVAPASPGLYRPLRTR